MSIEQKVETALCQALTILQTGYLDCCEIVWMYFNLGSEVKRNKPEPTWREKEQFSMRCLCFLLGKNNSKTNMYLLNKVD